MTRRTARHCVALAGLALAASSVCAQTVPVRISQVFGGGSSTGTAFGRDYVELYNFGASPIDLTGFSIQYAATTGTSWSARPLSGTIQPGKYFLISLTSTLAPTGAPELPVAPDVQTTTLAISATAGKVALVQGTTALTGSCPTGLIDFVGYGTGTNCFEGAGPAPAPSVANAVFRGAGGCTDTDANSTDFAAGAAAPRSSASPANATPCTPGGADLSVTIAGPSSCLQAPGASATYTFSATNWGPDATADASVVFTLPAGSTFVSSVPAATSSGNTVTFPVGALGVGGTFNGSVTVTLASPGVLVASVAAASSAADAATINNSAAAAPVRVYQFSNPLATAVFTNELGRKSALDAVNLPGINISGGDLSRPYASADGSRWIMKVDTDAGTGTTDEALIVGSGSTWSVVAREGVTPTAQGDLISAFGLYQAVNNAGDLAFDADTDGATTTDEVVLKQLASGGGLLTVAREGDSVPAIAGATYGTTMGSVSITAGGQAAFHTTLVGLTAATDTAFLSADGSNLLAQEGVGVPTNQVDGSNAPTTFTYKALGTGTSDATGSFLSADGASWNSLGSINASVTVPATSGVDIVLVQNNAVVVQENIAPSFSTQTADDLSPVGFNYLTPAGVWLAYGDYNGDIDWAARNGVLLAETDQPITTGNTETWSDATFSSNFFLVTSNAAGTTVVGGTTSETDTVRDAVLVLNGTTVVARQGDPIDINGNGLADDDAYIETFRNDHGFITADNVLYFSVQYRTAADICSNAAGSREAFVRVLLPVAPAGGRCCIGARCAIVTAQANCDPAGSAGAVFTAAATDCNTGGSLSTPCCFADYNKQSGITVQDIFDFLTDYFSGSVNANVSGDGTAAPTVQDIFDYLTAYFAGGC